MSEADFFELQERMFGPEVTVALRAIAGNDMVVKEQYMDFLKCRRFRQTLLCHRNVPLDRELKVERLRGLYAASPARPSSREPNLAAGAVEEFLGPKGTKITIDHGIGIPLSSFSETVSPAETTTYTLTAVNGTRNRSRDVRVIVKR